MSGANELTVNQIEVANSASSSNNSMLTVRSLSQEKREKVSNQDMLISVSNPRKVGNGIDAFIIYTVSTQTDLPSFKNGELAVHRRFKDFLILHEKLLSEHKSVGHLVPPPPDKSFVGMTLVKLSSHNQVDFCFIEKRRAALERYLNRIAKNQVLGKDVHFHDFLEQRGMLLRASQFNIRSSAFVIEMVKNIEVFSTDHTKIDESGSWFKEKHEQLGILNYDLKSVHHCFEVLIRHHRSVVASFTPFTEYLTILANHETFPPAATIYKQLSISFDKVSYSHEAQLNGDYFNVSEVLYDHLKIIHEISSLFDSRVKHWNNWQKYAQGLNKVKQEQHGNTTKAIQSKEKVEELEAMEDAKKLNFSNYSSVIRADVMSYKKTIAADFHELVLKFISNMIKRHERNIETWDSFLVNIGSDLMI